MTTQTKLDTIKQKVLTVLNSESVKGHKIRIKTKDDSDIIFFVDEVRIMEEPFFIDITENGAFTIHLMISYEDIKEIDDRTTTEILYQKGD